MATTEILHVRIPGDVKKGATKAFAAMGLTVADGIRAYLYRVNAEQRIPFELHVPNAKTRAAMKEAEEIIRQDKARFNSAEELFDDLDKKSKH
jgi:DNA-damage-inducible protein J